MGGFILGEKSGMRQAFTAEAERIPVTLINTKGCHLLEIKTTDKNGYFSVKLGFGQIKNIAKPQTGELKKAGIKTPLHFFREIRLPSSVETTEGEGKMGIIINDKKIYAGDEIKASDLFKIGDFVNVSGVSKGKGFQGVVRRHHFKGGPHTHGQSDRERAPGAVGSTTTPGRLYKGKRMAGRTGGKRITIKNLEIIEVKQDGLLVKGLLPGAKSGLLEVRSS